MARLVVYSAILLGVMAGVGDSTVSIMVLHGIFLLYSLFVLRKCALRFFFMSTLVFLFGYILGVTSRVHLIVGDTCEGYITREFSSGVGVRVLRCEALGEKVLDLYANCYGNGCPKLYTYARLWVTKTQGFGTYLGQGRIEYVHVDDITCDSFVTSLVLHLYREGYEFKTRFYNSLLMHASQEIAALGTSILFGEIGFTAELKEEFRFLGVLHIVAISGINIVYLQQIYRKLRTGEDGLWLLVVLYFIVGGQFTLVRAIITLCVEWIVKKAGEIKNRFDFLFTFVVIVIQNPLEVRNVSFWLVFGTCFGIYVINPMVQKKIVTLPNVFSNTVFSFVVWSCAAPFLYPFFDSIPLTGLLLSILLGPFIEIVTVFGYSTFGLFILNISGEVAIEIYVVLISIVLGIVRLFHGIL